ncbi:MAG: diacylglycerol kinase family lipid kinase [Anaerolineae bacterium]|nr:diacylglycerol kinase family lipid kinase [Anaerolineae bacterium]
MFKKVYFIVNPAAGKETPVLHQINRAMQGRPQHWELKTTRAYGDGARLARQALREGYDLVLAYGGDGTINDVVNGLAGTDLPLAVLRGGTGNAVAKELGTSSDLEASVTQTLDQLGEIRPVDLGIVDEHYFLLRLSIGIWATLSEATTREQKTRQGIAAYLLRFAESVAAEEQANYTITVDGETHTARGTGCVITNMSAIGLWTFNMGEEAQMDDGRLDIFIADSSLRTMLGVAANSTPLLPSLEGAVARWHGQRISLDADVPQKVSLDGEPFHPLPLCAEVRPQALQLFRPA